MMYPTPKGFVTAELKTTYAIWRGVLKRCLRKNSADYQHYGQKGITICERWRFFPDFVADMGVRPPGLSIDRIDPDKNYEPGNCRWLSLQENIQRRRPRPVRPLAKTINELTPRLAQVGKLAAAAYTAGEIAEKLGIEMSTARSTTRDAYRRTGVSSRRGMREWLAKQGIMV